MHVNILGDVTKHHRLEVTLPVVQKLLLKFENTLRYAVKGLLALLNALDEPCRGAHFFLQVLPGLLFRLTLLSDHPAVQRTYAQAGHAVIIEIDDIIIADFLHKNIGQDNADFLLLKASGRLGLQGGDYMRCIGYFIDRHTQFASELFVALGFQMADIIGDDPSRQTSAERQVFQLGEQTFSQVARRHADGVKKVDSSEHNLGFFGRAFRDPADVLYRKRQITVFIEVANNVEADGFLFFGYLR